ncbi:MAG: bacteriohemerythrin [Candidatus Zixiibacteriota bacterium]
MTIIEWSDEYLIHVDKIDKQHHRLFELLNNLENCGDVDSCAKKMAETIKGMVEYAHYHFAEEEKVMQLFNYPEIEKHKTSHKKLINQIKAFLIRLKKGKGVQSNELRQFLVDWLTNHIKTEDIPIGKHIACTLKVKESSPAS